MQSNIFLFLFVIICLVSCAISMRLLSVTVQFGGQVNSANTSTVGVFLINFQTTIINNQYNDRGNLSIWKSDNDGSVPSEVFREEISLLSSYVSNVSFNVTPGTYLIDGQVSDDNQTLGTAQIYLLVNSDGDATLQTPDVFFSQNFDFPNLTNVIYPNTSDSNENIPLYT